jgi:hypothetical protein
MGNNMHLTYDQLAHRFQFHPADDENTRDSHERVRDVCLAAADELVSVTGGMSREQSLAVTKLEEAMFWANAAIARGDGPKT